MNTIHALSEGTIAAIDSLVDYEIEREYGADVNSMIRGARTIALAGLQFDLRESYMQTAGATEQGLRGYAATTLRILVRDGLAARTCQCRQIHPHGCPHGSAIGQLHCSSHYEADVPPLSGALMCGTCHGAEYRTA